MNHVVAETDMPSRDVPIQTLDRAVLGAGLIPRLIKIDVEGFEADVLRGARAVLAAPELMVVQTENRAPEVVEMLKSVGMIEFTYDAFEHRLKPAGNAPMANALFVRDQSYVTNRVASASPVRVFDAMI
jgi:hypothetical protein